MILQSQLCLVVLLGQFGLICCPKLTIDLIDDLELDKRGHFRWIYVCILVCFNLYYSIRQHKCHFEKNDIMIQQQYTKDL